ncbi:Putative stress-induced transcription regulator [Lentzea fradiae]|uniref:Putative stress-induced transcription regulator n=1 Tax=Lentzea fradiae TaxID=200378 RepID=A0A1G7ZW68_9PSEU|nr:CGNR zinc finger domain-containing protein [Lentzea fradiae]SDH12901.1 Putative stress-induced transcription regulator [Lentzea fradiae]
MLAIDFVNTLTSEEDRLEEWLSAQGLPWSQEVVVLRGQVEAAILAARDGREPDLAPVNAALRGAPSFEVLTWDDGVVVTRSREGDEVARALATLAGAAAELLASPAVRKVKTCEGPGCRLLFVPAHPRRRWCDPATCGNRVRVARYYQRHKD